jgi:hypothetical protein
MRASAPWRLLPLAVVGSATIAMTTAAEADVGVDRVRPNVGAPGDIVDLRVACGGCPPSGLRLPVSVVRAARAPEPEPCGENVLCTPGAPDPPRLPPFRFLGRTGGNANSHLRFAIPDVKPGTYAFVVFCEPCRRGPSGSLIADDDDLLRVRASGEPLAADPGGIETTWWIAAGLAAGLVLAALARRRRA